MPTKPYVILVKKKIKETYDKFTEELKNIKTSQMQLDNIDGVSVTELNLEIHNLKTENFELNRKLESCQLNLSQKQKEFNETNNKLNALYKYELENKNKIKKLEEENSNLRADILNNSDSDKEDNKNNIKDNINSSNKLQKKLMKENEELTNENEKLQKYIVSNEFRYSLAMKAIFENKKLKKEINLYKEKMNKE